MKAKIDNIDLDGSPEEIAEFHYKLTRLRVNPATTVIETQNSNVNNSTPTKQQTIKIGGKRRWTKADDLIMINEWQDVANYPFAAKNNKKVAKKIGRTMEACYFRWRNTTKPLLNNTPINPTPAKKRAKNKWEYHKQWSRKDIQYLKANWQPSVSPTKKIRRHNKKVAKELGRLYEGCRDKYRQLKNIVVVYKRGTQ